MRMAFLLLASIVIISLTSCVPKKIGSDKYPGAKYNRDTLYNKYGVIEEIGKRIQFEKIPATNVLYVKYTGNYRKHPDAFPKLQDYAYANYAAVGNCIGLYAYDPDIVAEADLTWEVAIRIVPGAPSGNMMHDMKMDNDPFHLDASPAQLGAQLSEFRSPATNFAIKTLPPVTAITVTTIVEKAGIDGLAMDAWLTINGYVQTGVARMEFAMVDKNPMKIPVKISIPVVKRKTGLKLSGF